ncbi:MAG: acetate--CoA ligase family protein [Acidimicrobiales bacterium]
MDVTGRPVELRPLDLDRFFRPHEVVVVGASDTEGRATTAMTRRIRSWATRTGAALYLVNPNRDRLGDLPCYPSITDVPAGPDLVMVLVGDVLTAVTAAVEHGARFVVVAASGFAELGAAGARLQGRLEAAVAGSDAHLLGPNTNLNALEEFRDDLPPPAIALITQSGHQGRPIFQAQEIGIAVSHWAPTGNEADLEVADFARYFADQPQVGAIAAYVEGFKDGRTLILAADHALRRGVPIVVVKVGRTAQGRQMAKAHTGHLTGSDAVISAVFRQYGVVRVDDLDQLLETSTLFARTREPRGDGVCVYSISGGTSAHVADLAAGAGLRLPRLGAGTRRELHQWIPDYLEVGNPVDCGGPPVHDWRGRRILDTILADPVVGVLVVPIAAAMPGISEYFARDLAAVAETTDKAVCVVWASPLCDDPAYREVLLPSRVAVFRSSSNCLRAVRSYLDYHAVRRRHRSPFVRPRRRASPQARRARLLLPRDGGSVSEHIAIQLLREYGIPVAPQLLAGNAAESARVAATLGFPVVCKLCSPDLPHKSDLGLVIMGLRTAVEVRRAYAELVRRVSCVAPAARVQGVLVASQVDGGVETVVGAVQDELFGPTVMFGLGGVLVETLGDVTFRVAPFGRAEARRMLTELRGFPLLRRPRRGQPPDIGALVDVIMRVQSLAVDLAGEIAELDINPLSARPDGAIALDALVVPGGRDRSH